MVNKVILVGNVGKDPEVRHLDNGATVASFTLATTERGYKTANGTEVPERTEWHNIVVWRGLADVAEKYVRKGSQLYIEGKITYRSYDAKDGGGKRYVTEIVADTMNMLGRKGEGSSNNGGYAASAAEPQPSFGNAPEPTDDLPF
ncbi:MAG: single-stranded DNA-binding protein [Salinivirgaceae bacterium]|nr:single-stranded DNA-binding protein [Salinivirgaceae bacterium]